MNYAVAFVLRLAASRALFHCPPARFGCDADERRRLAGLAGWGLIDAADAYDGGE